MKIREDSILYLGDEYCAEIDQIDETRWSHALSLFDDATIYQTMPYGKVRWGSSRLSHIMVKKNGNIAGIAQITIMKLPLLGTGIAYVPWGPLWKLKGDVENLTNFLYILHALKKVYAQQRGLLLRIEPNILSDNNLVISSLIKEGFNIGKKKSYHTFLLDLSPRVEELRKCLDPKWRNKLNKVEKNNLIIKEGNAIILYDTFAKLYLEMKGRKIFDTAVDIEQFRKIQLDLPEDLKPRILICEHEGEPISAIVCSAIGNTGIYLLGATGDKGLTLKGSYLLHWHMIKWLKKTNYRYYDLGGIDPDKNQGVYHFKAGFKGKDAYHICQHEVCTNLLSKVAVRTGDFLRGFAKVILFSAI